MSLSLLSGTSEVLADESETNKLFYFLLANELHNANPPLKL